MYLRWLATLILGAALASVYYRPVMAAVLRVLTVTQLIVVIGVGFVAWIFLAGNTIHTAFRGRNPEIGKSWQHETSLAGKAFGVVYPNVLVPLALAGAAVIIAVGWFQGIHQSMPAAFSITLSLVALIAFAYVRQFIQKAQRRSQLERRPVLGESQVISSFGIPAEREAAVKGACARVAAETRAVLGCLRPDDRFGHEIGTFSSLDPTLDRLARWLMERKAGSRERLDLSKIKTLRDYVWVWAWAGRSP
jgi:hypothetical protein